ncbi:LSm family protein, partial [Staphylococcus epidermidis]
THQLEPFIQPVLNHFNFQLLHIDYLKQPKHHFLTISIDKEAAVHLNHSTIPSQKITQVMHQNHPIPQIYYLHLASPPAQTPIKKEKHF